MAKNQHLIWILEDDEGSRFVYNEMLGLHYGLRIFETARSFLSALENADDRPRPDLIIADLRLPDESFVNLLSDPQTKDLLAKHRFLVVSSVDDIDILRFCFREGALDYITKPFGKSELVVKVERLLNGEKQLEVLCEIDPITMSIEAKDGSRVSLTAKEFQILTMLNEEEAHFVTRDMLVSRIWNRIMVNTKTIDIHIFNLRRKLQQAGFSIEFQSPNRYVLSSQKRVNP